MHRYTIEVDGRAFAVDVESVDDPRAERFRVVVEGREFDVALAASAQVSGVATAPAAMPQIVPVERTRPAPVPARSAAAAQAGERGDGAGPVLRAPMPGAILSVSVAVGAQVRRGQDVAVLEAMKMENVLRAPETATVVEVCVTPGQQVAHGHPIVRFARAEEVPG